MLGQRGGAAHIGRDLCKAAHRHYATAPAADVRTAGAKVRPDTTRWQTTVEEYVRDHGLDAVVESALSDPEKHRASSAAYHRSRHLHDQRLDKPGAARAGGPDRRGTGRRPADVLGGGAVVTAVRAGWSGCGVRGQTMPVAVQRASTAMIARPSHRLASFLERTFQIS
ncbi:zeta toxin family protein [Streptomyces achromogenes]|uniref:UDP-N-acetylglucosamine kinase n=1 Tax=Streptomyces achromogenes TaxID=67255 RepID=A0ABZ1KIA0_STRAH